MKTKTFLLMATCAILCGCHSHTLNHSHPHEHSEGDALAQSEAHSAGHTGLIEISPERQEVLGIKTTIVEARDFGGVIHSTGQILSSAQDEMAIVAPSEGILIIGNFAEGSPVGKGSRIGLISSKSIGTGDLLSKARITYETAEKEYQRDLQLRQDNIVSESHLDKSRLEYEHARSEYEALTQGGVSDEGVIVSSPMSGFIKRMNGRSGDFVRTGSLIATVSRNKRLQLRADVSEKYFGLISQVKGAVFKTAYSDRTYDLGDLGGKLLSYGRASEVDAYIPIIFEFDNKGDFVPGAFVEVFLKTSSGSNPDAVAVPLGAVVEDQGVRYVFVKVGEDDFEKREVETGLSDAREIQITKGLSQGEEIVSLGAIHVKLAGVSAVPAGHTHNH